MEMTSLESVIILGKEKRTILGKLDSHENFWYVEVFYVISFIYSKVHYSLCHTFVPKPFAYKNDDLRIGHEYPCRDQPLQQK